MKVICSDNGPKSLWRCQDRSCNGRHCMDNDMVINMSGIHHHPPNKANITAQTVKRKMKKYVKLQPFASVIRHLDTVSIV